MKKQQAITERYFVPAVLFLLNIALAHTVFAFVDGSPYSGAGKIAIATSFALLVLSLLIRKRVFLFFSMVLYTALLFLL